MQVIACSPLQRSLEKLNSVIFFACGTGVLVAYDSLC